MTQIHTDRMVFEGDYHHEMIIEVDTLHLSPDGLVGVQGDRAILHGHHRNHPNKARTLRPRKFRPDRLLSIGFTGHYEYMSQHFGPVPVGRAAEDIVIDHDGHVNLADIQNGIQIHRDGFIVELPGGAVAEPCAPFTRHLLEMHATKADPTQAREFLKHGIRGFVFGPPSNPPAFTITTGDTVMYQPSTRQEA